jgi:serine/threonine protein kinase
MLATLARRLHDCFGGAPPLEPLAVLQDDPTVLEGLRRVRERFAARVQALCAQGGEAGTPADPRIAAIGGFPVLRVLGRGGMGTVYLALNEAQQQVVIKVPFSEFAGPQYAEVFFREFQALSTVRHENIVRVHRYGKDEQHGVYYYVAEFVDGVTLKDFLEAGAQRTFTPAEAAAVSLAVVRAIRVLRSRNITHRDLKPGNVMFDQTGQVKLIDFGSAKITGQTSELTHAGIMVGTFDYLAPEAGRGEGRKVVGAARDLYALGVMHYRMLMGRLPVQFGTGQSSPSPVSPTPGAGRFGT